MSDGALMMAGRWCKWILTHNLALIVLALSSCHSDQLGCNIHGGVHSTLIYTWRCLYDVLLLMQVNSSRHFLIRELHTVPHFVRSLLRLLLELRLAATKPSHSFHAYHLQLLHSQVMLCSVAFGKILQNPCQFAVAWCASVALVYVCSGPYFPHMRYPTIGAPEENSNPLLTLFTILIIRLLSNQLS